jgi:FkbM family methyltransferase
LSIQDAIVTLRRAGLPINVVYDIGACRGDWTRQIKVVLPAADFVMFEANPAYRDMLEQSGLGQVIIECVSNPGRGSVEFFNGANTGDSYYRENTSVYENQTGICLPSFTLDEVMDQHMLPPPDFIKLDTQGSELDILAGAPFALQEATLVLIEVPFVEYNQGAPGIGDYFGYMKANAFLPLALTQLQFHDNVMVQGDVLFIKREAKLKYLGPNRILRI